MSTKTLRRFQELAVESGVGLFLAARDLLDASGNDAASRAAAINHNGYLLIEAPTGAGKTLMAGTMVEKVSHEEKVVWFWFAPFKGVVGQTAAFLREQFHGLRLREMADDRATDMSRQGDVCVTTWQTVATRVKDKRNVRKDRETNPSIDTLIEQLRTQGFRIGVVVDEAHHSFGEGTQATKFFRDVLKPEYTILITATPDDDDVKVIDVVDDGVSEGDDDGEREYVGDDESLAVTDDERVGVAEIVVVTDTVADTLADLVIVSDDDVVAEREYDGETDVVVVVRVVVVVV